MPWWQSARLARVAAASIVAAGTCAPSGASGAELDLVQWFTDAAAPALYAAAPANDAALAAREALNRGLSGAFTQLQPVGPIWLQGVGVGVSFDPTFQPSYALSVTQPLLRTVDHDASIDLHGHVLHDTTGRTDGHLGLRYHGRVHARQMTLGLQGAIDNNWQQDVERYTLGAELRLGQLGVRASGFDDAPQRPATRQIAKRRLDGYQIAIDARIPYLPWASLEVDRFWQMAANGEGATTRDRVSLRLTPLAPLQIGAGTQREGELRSAFAQVRWRVMLGG
jgi:Inverse autotransporter, beta-domain